MPHAFQRIVVDSTESTMELSAGWFIVLAALTCGAACLGHWVGRGSAWRARVWLSVGVMMLVIWAWLYNHPAVAVGVIPSSVLRYVEGVAGAPFFMFCNAIAWGRATKPRQRRTVQLAMAVGVIYFLHGGMWMLQSTPATALGQEPSDRVMQSQDYSCVAAACATALNHLGVATSEAEMAMYTETRIGNGATTIRALDGLKRRLRNTHVKAALLDVPLEDLHHMPTPLITSLQFQQSQGHMVVIFRVDRKGATVLDPVDGMTWMSRASLAEFYRGEVIAFERPARQDLLIASASSH